MREDLSSVSEWLAAMKNGCDEAKAKLWRRYYERLVEQARRKLQGASRRMADEEDVASEAFERFFRGIKAGRFPMLDDRDDLWQILMRLTKDRAVDHRRSEEAAKRGGGEVRGDSAFADGLERAVAAGPTPAEAAEVAEEVGRRLAQLGDEKLKRIAVMKMAGHTNAEVAGEMGVAVATVERRLGRIRREWQDE